MVKLEDLCTVGQSGSLFSFASRLVGFSKDPDVVAPKSIAGGLPESGQRGDGWAPERLERGASDEPMDRGHPEAPSVASPGRVPRLRAVGWRLAVGGWPRLRRVLRVAPPTFESCGQLIVLAPRLFMKRARYGRRDIKARERNSEGSCCPRAEIRHGNFRLRVSFCAPDQLSGSGARVYRSSAGTSFR